MMSKATNQFSALILTIFKTNGMILAWGDQFVAPFGLTSARWQMLGALALSKEPLAAPRIADSMGVTRQGAQKQLNLLLKEGLIERLPNPLNLRSPVYQLTSLGHEHYQSIDKQWQKHVRFITQQLNAQDLHIANQVLTNIAALHSPISSGD
ncbi:MarR family winged helix-turn-helix transcriptional regulator [Thiospirillum jenense]|uniref:Winged helix-turn-helix transcriptional regulator n=1 Tax=Thiospirillum jenense TaxID=1653858 RepID=A0A839HIG3_9GAMM|nr:MarR family winged helix-turn-helix transcriptional regulator [Thiospirillum jenense]MBB1125872.1 winged helix-turn-helix transcriptional regulator [Thiospirillum jenense]